MKKKIGILLSSILILSCITVTTNASEDKKVKEVSQYTVTELEFVFTEFCEENNININKGSSEYEKYLRDFLMQEEYSIDDVHKINMLRAYAAIYLNKDMLESNLDKNNLKNNSIQNDSLEIQTVGDIKAITEQDEKNSYIESLFQPRYYVGYNANLSIPYATSHVH